MTIHGAKGLEFHYVFIVGLGNISFFFVHESIQNKWP